jgi:hypothetical protein
MRLFAFCCYIIAAFYAYTAIDSMRRGIVYPMSGNTSVPAMREDANSPYAKYLAARWLIAAGFILSGAVMQYFASRFDKLDAPK